MPQELTTQELLDAFADEVAQELGTHCRTDRLTGYERGMGGLIIDDDGRAVRLCQPDDRRPDQLKIYAALPDETEMTAPSIRVTASSAHHVAREVTRRLYPLHTEAAQQAAERAAQQQAEESSRRAVAEAVAGALPGARGEEQYRRTRIISGSTTPGRPGSTAPSGSTASVQSSAPPGSGCRSKHPAAPAP
ncbi:hypothetical protein OG729_39425 [Streptomyces sp. NBC_00210]|uniref:hypothetical protein n=1 Tax=Streptomyces sp. NBC_00210 TaxID=2903636 RepID=UPI00324F6BB4